MSKKYVLAFDQGTTSCRALVFEKDVIVVGSAQKEFTQYYPKPGWGRHTGTCTPRAQSSA